MKKVSVELLNSLISVIVTSKTEYSFLQIQELIKSVNSCEDIDEKEKEA